jgi:hypothetical protein
MIQRIQSLWLLILIILSLLLLEGGIVNFVTSDGQKYLIGFSGISKVTGTGSEIIRESFLLTVLLVMMPLISLCTILLYKSLRLQKVFAIILTIFLVSLVLLIVYYSYLTINNNNCQVVAGIRMIIPIMNPIFSVMALKGISKDEMLLKSYDRIR